MTAARTRTTGTTTTAGTTGRETTADGGPGPAPARRPWISARVRILLWLLAVMAVALGTVATTTRSILVRDVDHRVTRLLEQETGEFANFVDRGRDPATGRPFTEARRLLKVFLERQYADPDEELLGVVRGKVIRQDRDIPSALPLHQDEQALRRITSGERRSGVLHRPQGEVRWARVPIEPGGGAPSGTFIVAFHADREQAGPQTVFRILLAISGVALLLTCGIGWAVAGRILAPVRLVRTTAAQLTEQDLTRRIPVRGRDDISALAETFNAMLDRLERAFAAQRQFVDDAGHELRTPITIVRGHLELMGDGPEEREETVRVVTDELDRMSRIVEDLLLLAKAERPDFVTPEPVELAELTADVFVKARALGERGWRLAEVAEGTVHVDPQRITQAMVQLAQNAVQHTARGTPVHIGSRRSRTGHAVELYVADSGPGVSAADAELIFERFRRGTARRGSRGSGAGLGLAIVKAIAQGHPGGRVELRPTAGGGATFVLVLPESGAAHSEQEEEDI
ncbi:sensor histidine kinase [Streptomyces sp. CA-250714]|uniref:sensor histidine kinase n=1 Tax=Streptomyces sp. CA-250714 TaxID=3240060 RepID=UPI003D8DA9AA